MKIIIGKEFGNERTVCINAREIQYFMVYKDSYNGGNKTVIVFNGSKIDLAGDVTKRIADFMMTEDNCGILDLTIDGEDKRSFWSRRESE